MSFDPKKSPFSIDFGLSQPTDLCDVTSAQITRMQCDGQICALS